MSTDKDCKTLLAKMLDKGYNGDYVLLFHHVSNKVYELPPRCSHTDELAKEIGMSENALTLAAEYLEKCGYLGPYIFCGRHLGYRLTYKGIHWKRFSRLETLDWIASKVSALKFW